MKTSELSRTRVFAAILVLFFFSQHPVFGEEDFLPLWGPYFGQEEPGTAIGIFADGIISGN